VLPTVIPNVENRYTRNYDGKAEPRQIDHISSTTQFKHWKCPTFDCDATSTDRRIVAFALAATVSWATARQAKSAQLSVNRPHRTYPGPKPIGWVCNYDNYHFRVDDALGIGGGAKMDADPDDYVQAYIASNNSRGNSRWLYIVYDSNRSMDATAFASASSRVTTDKHSEYYIGSTHIFENDGEMGALAELLFVILHLHEKASRDAKVCHANQREVQL
jgi:hypothetical protein